MALLNSQQTDHLDDKATLGPLITRGIFGAPLKSASLCGSTSLEYGLTVPDPVYRCFEEILKRGNKKMIKKILLFIFSIKVYIQKAYLDYQVLHLR